MLLAAGGCAPTVSSPQGKNFVLADPSKYKTATEEELARQFAENDCKSKAVSASATVHKAVMAQSAGNLGLTMRANKEAGEMYSSTFTACMNKAGYLLKSG